VTEDTEELTFNWASPGGPVYRIVACPGPEGVAFTIGRYTAMLSWQSFAQMGFRSLTAVMENSNPAPELEALLTGICKCSINPHDGELINLYDLTEHERIVIEQAARFMNLPNPLEN